MTPKNPSNLPSSHQQNSSPKSTETTHSSNLTPEQQAKLSQYEKINQHLAQDQIHRTKGTAAAAAKMAEREKKKSNPLHISKSFINNSYYNYKRKKESRHALIPEAQASEQKSSRYRSRGYYEPYIDHAEVNRFKFSIWYRQIKKKPLFRFTVIFTILSGLGSAYAVWDDRQNAQRRHEGIFKDIIRQNVRRRLNGFVPLSDHEVEVRYGRQVREEFQEWYRKNADVVRDVERKSVSPEQMYRAKMQDVV